MIDDDNQETIGLQISSRAVRPQWRVCKKHDILLFDRNLHEGHVKFNNVIYDREIAARSNPNVFGDI